MKTSSWALFNLIHSLSEEEKKFFIRISFRYRKKGKNFLMRLFKSIEKTERENYDERILAKEIPNLSVRKKELYESILNSLADRQRDVPFLDMLMRIRYTAILSYRLLMNETMEMLTQVDKIATDQNQLYIKGTLLQYKIIFLDPAFRNYISLDWKQLSDDFLSNASTIQLIANIFSRFIEANTVCQSNLLLRSHAAVARMKTMLHDKFFTKDVSSLPVTHQGYFHFTRFQINRALTRYQNALGCMEDAWRAVMKNPDYYQSRRPIEYLYIYTIYVTALLDARQMRRLPHIISEYNRTVADRYSKYEYGQSKQVILNLKYQYILSGCDLDPQIIQSAGNHLEEHKNQMSHENKRELELMLLLSCFITKDFSAAWSYAHDLMNDTSGKLRQETLEMARIMFWLILWEEKELNDLKNQLEKFKRLRSRKGNEGYGFEQTLSAHFEKLLVRPNDPKSTRIVFQNLKKEWAALRKKNDICTNFYLNQFDFLDWTDEKTRAR